MKKEFWIDIEGYENLYMISNLGRIRSLYTKKGFSNQYGIILKPWLDKAGYEIVGLTKNGKQRHHKVHRLVAFAFLKNDNDRNLVNHKNGIKNDNRIINLEWCTEKENTNHYINSNPKNFDRVSRLGKSCRKVDWETVKKMREAHKSGKYTVTSLSEKFKVNRGTTWDIISYRRYLTK